MPAPQLPGMVVLDTDALRTIADCDDNKELAALLGLNERTLGRLGARQIEPGESVWKAFLIKFPHIDPRRVFRHDPEAVRRRPKARTR